MNALFNVLSLPALVSFLDSMEYLPAQASLKVQPKTEGIHLYIQWFPLCDCPCSEILIGIPSHSDNPKVSSMIPKANKPIALSHVQLLATPWTAAHQAPPSMGFSRQEYWSGVPLPSI